MGNHYRTVNLIGAKDIITDIITSLDIMQQFEVTGFYKQYKMLKPDEAKEIDGEKKKILDYLHKLANPYGIRTNLPKKLISSLANEL